MKILITGGAGFIASHVVDAYLYAGHEVVVLDDLSTGRRENVNAAADLVVGDIRNHTAVNMLLEQERFDVINHHAAQMDVRRSVREPIFDAEVNILGTLNLIDAASRTGVQRFIYVSTGGAVYGEPAQLPVTETDPVRPECHYGISKHTPEHYLALYRKLTGLTYVVLRYPNVYGPRQRPDGEAGVIAIFTRRILRDEPVTLYVNAKGESAMRDYVYVTDIADANTQALTRGDNQIICLGSGRGTSTDRILELIRQELKRGTLVTQTAPLRPGEIERIFLASAAAAQHLGWCTTIPLKTGVGATVLWIKEQEQTP